VWEIVLRQERELGKVGHSLAMSIPRCDPDTLDSTFYLFGFRSPSDCTWESG
jgi:hypothetical protein